MVTKNKEDQTVTIHIFGFLRRHLDERGLPYVLTESVPPEGMSAHALVERLLIPPKEVEAVLKMVK